MLSRNSEKIREFWVLVAFGCSLPLPFFGSVDDGASGLPAGLPGAVIFCPEPATAGGIGAGIGA